MDKSPQDRKEDKIEKSSPPDDAKGEPMDIDEDSNDFLLGPDADSDFGSDYDTAVDEDEKNVRNDPFEDLVQHTFPSNGSTTMNSHLAWNNSEVVGTVRPNLFRDLSGHPYASNGDGTSSASTQAAIELALQSVDLSRHSRSTAPPPTYTAIASQGSVPARSGPLCIVCHARPAFNNGYKSFPTCGTTCGQVLKQATNSPNIIHGQMGNPYGNGSSSRHPLSGSSRNHSQQENSFGRSSQSQGPIKMCDVCRLRPRYQKGGKVYPTCGLTCAAKLQPPGSVPKCDYCKQRPKVVINGKIFPHCGRTCRDKAKNAAAAALSSATCTTCIVCWKAPRISPRNEFCSDLCQSIADTKAPLLLEIPRGHASFKQVSEYYTREWKNARKKCPEINGIYMVHVKPTLSSNYEKYQGQLNTPMGVKTRGNEARHWLGTTRDCGFGDTGNAEPCSSSNCPLCNIVKASASPKSFPKGIITTQYLERAIETSSKPQKSSSKVVLLTQVLLGIETERTLQEIAPPLPPPGYNSIRLVEYRTFGGKTDYHGEHIVFNADALKPLYLISYK